jgi:Domain of unknown function (DUF1877)
MNVDQRFSSEVGRPDQLESFPTMACRGVLFAITEEEAQRLTAARGNDASVLSIVQDEIEQAWDEAHLCQTDKAWDAIHRCLGDGTLANGEGPLSLCILGGKQLHVGDNYIISLLTPEEVTQVAAALFPLDKKWFRDRYFKIDPADYTELSEEDFEYTWEYFETIRKFYQKAEAEDLWSIFTVDQ